ncbi:anti-sigma factor [uncultured Serinicoccus sp.]|uniref:anti-sigma factor n=1 Tax=uncultured Serinicoccus sp. TaxID=735514 RepID=UPI0026345A80|nr:anti-sigma factor [uncultured Serinicoccus sp.]
MNHDERYAGRPADDVPPDRTQELLARGGDLAEAPGDAVWERIRAEIEGEDQLAGRRRAAGRDVGARRRPGRWPLLAAAAAGALVAWVGTQVVGAGQQDEEIVVADATLEDLPDAGGAVDGSAEVVSVDGERRLRVQLDELPDTGSGYLEVWLLRPDVSGLVTVGVISGTTAEFSLPATVDLEEYPVVDISREQLDGDPSHGGESIVRGELHTAGASALPGDPPAVAIDLPPDTTSRTDREASP